MTELKSLRIPIMMTTGEVSQIDEWRRSQADLPSRSEAIRRLVRHGLGQPLPPPIEAKATAPGRFRRPPGRPAAIPKTQDRWKDDRIGKALQDREFITLSEVCEHYTGFPLEVAKRGTSTFDPQDTKNTCIAQPHIERTLANSLLRLGWVEAIDTLQDETVWVPRETLDRN